MRDSMLILKSIAVFIILILGLSNCAVFNRNNTPLVVKVEENLVPEETGKKILAAPIFIPLGLIAGILDLIIVHPIMRIPDAFEDTVSILWTPRGNGYVTNMGFLPISIAMTPIIFTLDLLARSSFDINGNVDRSRIESNPVPKKTVYEALESGDRATILALLKIPVHNWPPDLSQKIIEKYRDDPEIRKLGLERLSYSLNEKNYTKYELVFVNMLNRDWESDQSILHFFERFKSRAGEEAMLKLISTKKLPEKIENYYLGVLLGFARPVTVQNLFDFFLNNNKYKHIILGRLDYIIRYSSAQDYKEYERYFADSLNKDPELDSFISTIFIRNKSAKGSEAMTKLLISGRLSKASLRLYAKTILEIGVEKDMQIILEKFSVGEK